MIYPFGVVPFTYATSFIFTSENIAQTVTIFLHFVFSGIGAIVVFVLRLIQSTEAIGNKLKWILKFIPSYCLTDAVMFVSSKSQLVLAQPNISQSNFNIQNLGGDLLILAVHFCVWTSFLIMVELGAFSWLWHMLPCNRGVIHPRDNLDLDGDVIEEEERVQSANKDNMKVRVHRFRKVYK